MAFFQQTCKKFQYFQKNCQCHFFGKKTIFFGKKCQAFGNFLTFKWHIPEGQVPIYTTVMSDLALKWVRNQMGQIWDFYDQCSFHFVSVSPKSPIFRSNSCTERPAKNTTDDKHISNYPLARTTCWSYFLYWLFLFSSFYLFSFFFLSYTGYYIGYDTC